MKQYPRRCNTYRLTDHDYSDSSYAYFVTLDTKIKAVEDNSPVVPACPFTSCPDLRKQAIQSLLFYREQGKWLIFAYCLMPDHLHLLVTPQDGANLSSLIGNYESYTTRTAWRYGVIGSFWQRSFYDHILRSSEDSSGIVAYILDNPRRAGLVEHWEDWPWCGTPDQV
jgi:REP element-mobilizing transposase RayT